MVRVECEGVLVVRVGCASCAIGEGMPVVRVSVMCAGGGGSMWHILPVRVGCASDEG